MLSARRYVAALNIDLQTLADQAHVHRNTVARASESVSVQYFLSEAIRVIRAATDLSGDVHRALLSRRFTPRTDSLPARTARCPADPDVLLDRQCPRQWCNSDHCRRDGARGRAAAANNRRDPIFMVVLPFRDQRRHVRALSAWHEAGVGTGRMARRRTDRSLDRRCRAQLL